ncbi:MAG: hypothetical protein HQK99_07935 [Nitrospirae bacterium]|nr:hypothetical protein [Nitrospirota bacterium]
MDNGYYVDVVTKNILSALSEHISDAISDQLIGVVKKTMAQLEAKLLAMFDGAGKGVNAEQIDAIAKTVEGGLASIVSEIKASLGENNSAELGQLRAAIAEMGAKIERMERSLSTARTDQAEILKMMLEGELRNAEAMAERVHGNRMEIGERLKRLNGLIESASPAETI